MALRLKPALNIEMLATRPHVPPDQSVDVLALACSVRILLRKDQRLASGVLDSMKDIYRRAFHKQHPNACDDVMVDRDTLEFIREYFVERFHPEYFGGKAVCESIRKFLRLADQRFINIEIRGTSAFNDFVVTGTIPGSCIVLLARITDDTIDAPSMPDIGMIVLNRRANLDYGRPVVAGLIAGAIIDGVLMVGLNIPLPEYGPQGIVLACMLCAAGLVWGFNTLKDRSFAKRYPKLAPVL